MYIENWNGYEIRFTQQNNTYMAVAKDVAEAMGYRDAFEMLKLVPNFMKGTGKVSTLGGVQEMMLVSEQGLYFVFARSRKPEAENFLIWLTELVQMLRFEMQLETQHAFRMLDKEVQRLMMDRIGDTLDYVPREHYQMVNQMANELTSVMYGYEKHITKNQMNDKELEFRKFVLQEIVHLHEKNLEYGLDVDIYKVIKERYITGNYEWGKPVWSS